MMRRLLFWGSSCLATVLVLIAQTSVHTFKWAILFEPEVPESLR